MNLIAAIFRSRRFHVRDFHSVISFPAATLPPSGQPLSSAVQAIPTQLVSSAHNLSTQCHHDREGGKRNSPAASSLHDLLFELIDVIPDTARRFFRVPDLTPHHVLHIVSSFQAECEKDGFTAAKVEPLWRIFCWATEHDDAFEHLPRTYTAMAQLLTSVGLLQEAEFLLFDIESRGLVLDNPQFLCDLIEEYAVLGELDRAIAIYDRVCRLDFVPCPSCYHALIDLLVRKRKTQLAFSVCCDMVERCTDKLHGEAKRDIDNVVRLLCGSGRIQEVRNLVKKAKFSKLEWEPCGLVLNDLTAGYCKKKDFEDLLSLYRELGCKPDHASGNRIINTLCREFGSERGDFFRLELEDLGFEPNDVTFGILICWSCHEGSLKSAFISFSEVLSRGLAPNVFSYNALICGLFSEGMWKHVREIWNEMVERRALPDYTTYKILLAGYSKARQFEQLRNVIDEMQQRHLVTLTPLQDPFSKAFEMLGFSPRAVRLKRESHVGCSRTEFLDSLGNGLYLETDLDNFDTKLDAILRGFVVPDFNALVMKECTSGNPKLNLLLLDEMSRWGQDLSLPVLSALTKELCLSRCSIKEVSRLMEKMPTSFFRLDEVTLDSLASFFCKKRLNRKGKALLWHMLERKMTVKSETYAVYLASFCKEGDWREYHKLWHLALENKWIPELNDSKFLLERLCGKKLLPEIVELFERMLLYHPISQVCEVFFEKLSSSGFTKLADKLAKEMELRGWFLDHVAKGHLIKGYCYEKNHSAALQVFDNTRVDKLDLAPDVLVMLIPPLWLADRSTEADTIRDNLLKEHPLILLPVYSALLEGYAEAGNFRKASGLFQDLWANGTCPGVEVYELIFQRLSQSNNSYRVKEFLAFMIRRNVSPSVYSFRLVIRIMCIQGRLDCALGLTKFVLRQRIRDGLPIYNILIFYVFTTGKSQLIHSILEEMQEQNFLPDEVTYNFLIWGFSRCKDFPSSLRYLSAMISNGSRPSNRSLRNIISCLLGALELGKVKDLYREMESRGWVYSTTVHNTIVNGLVSSGELREAEFFVDRMQQNRSVPDGVIYDGLIKQLCWQGRVEKGIDLLNLMLKKRSVPVASSYNLLINNLCANNDVDRAMDIHAKMMHRALTPSMTVVALMVQKCCEVGRTVEAESLLASVFQTGRIPTREMYDCIINRYRADNNSRKASEIMQAMQQTGHKPDFETHWSLINSLNQLKGVQTKASNRQGFLSRLLSGSGFSWKNDSKHKGG